MICAMIPESTCSNIFEHRSRSYRTVGRRKSRGLPTSRKLMRKPKAKKAAGSGGGPESSAGEGRDHLFEREFSEQGLVNNESSNGLRNEDGEEIP